MDITRDNLLSLIRNGLKQHTLSIAALEKNAGVPKDTVRDFLRAKTQILRADKLQKVMRVLQPEPELVVRAVMGDGGFIQPLPPEQQTEKVDFPAGLVLSTLQAVRIAGNAMEPVLQPGWIICYSTSASAPANGNPKVPYGKREEGVPYSEMLGKPCVVALADGKLVLRTLKKGSGAKSYTLAAYNAPDIADAVVKDVYKIVFIQPA